MEGLIPFVFRALKKNKQLHTYKSLSDSSRRSYHHLLSGGNSFNGSAHRRTQSEFQPPSSASFFEYGQPEFNDIYTRSRSLKKDSGASNLSTVNRESQDHHLREQKRLYGNGSQLVN